jgi:hypothetical protein
LKIALFDRFCPLEQLRLWIELNQNLINNMVDYCTRKGAPGMKSLAVLVAITLVIGAISVAPLYGGESNGEGAVIASISRIMTYQGILKDNAGQPVGDGTYNLTFRLYDASSEGTLLWTSSVTQIHTVNGYFTAELGPVNLPFDDTYYLSIQVQGDSEMAQRQKMTAGAYALRGDSADYALSAVVADDADRLDGLNSTDFALAEHNHDDVYVNENQPDAITSGMIVDGTVSFDDIGPNGASSGQVMKWNGSAWTAANDSVGSGGGAGDITAVYPGAGLEGGGAAGDVTLSIAPDGVDHNMIAPNAVGSLQIMDYSIEQHDINDDAINSDKVIDGSLTGNDIQDGTITGSDIAPDAVGSNQIQDFGVAFQDLASNCVRSDKVQDNSITSDDIQDGSITSTDIADNTISFDDIGQNSASSGQIMKWNGSTWVAANDSVGNGGSGDITAVYPGAGLEGGGTSGDVTLSIAAGGVDHDMIAPDAVSSDRISDNTIIDVDIAPAAAIAASKINDGTGSGLDADLLDGLNSSDFLSTASDYGRSGVASNLYEGSQTLTQRYVNSTGPDSVVGSGLANALTAIGLGGIYGRGGSGDVYSPTGVTGYAESNGTFSNYAYGVYGSAKNSVIFGGNAYGGYFSADTNGTGSHYGVYGYSDGYGVYGSGGAYGVYYSGGLAGTGTKSCVVKTSQGPTLLYCQESPENWFEDLGNGQLNQGRTHIELDPLFLETVTIDQDNPLKVFIQVEGECNGVYVAKGATGFDVVELNKGTSDISFSYRVVAKRKGFEDRRLDYTAAGVDDPYLYPEAATKIREEQRRMQERLEGSPIQTAPGR